MNVKILPIILAFIAFLPACEEDNGIPESELPQLALEIFYTKYEGATNVVWTRNYSQYLVSFTYNEKQSTGRFTNAGDWLITQTPIEYEDIPAEVIASLRESEFKFWIIQDQNHEDTPKFGELYRLVMYDNTETKPLYFEEDGARVNKAL